MPDFDPLKYKALEAATPAFDPEKYNKLAVLEEPVVVEEEPIRKSSVTEEEKLAFAKSVAASPFPEGIREPLRERMIDLSSRLPESLRKPAAFASSLALDIIPEMLVGGIGKRGVEAAKKAPSLIRQATKGNVTYKEKAVPGLRTPPRVEPKFGEPEKITGPPASPREVAIRELAEIRQKGLQKEPDLPITESGRRLEAERKAIEDAAGITKRKQEVDIVTGKPKKVKQETWIDEVTGEEVTGPKPKRAEASRIRTSDPEKGKKILEEVSGQRSAPSLAREPAISLQEPIRQSLPPIKPPTTKGPQYSPIEYMNIPKAFSASGDISFPFRQGLALIRRKEWWQSWKPMLRSLTSEDSYQKLQKEITSNPRFQEAVEKGLSLTDFPGQTLPTGLSKSAIKKLGQQEEQFASRVAEKITGGKYSFIRASNRAYTAFANNLRIKTYENLTNRVDDLIAKGDIANPDLVKKNIADYINTASGRGSMGLRIGEKSQTLERAAELLNTTFWSPRFLASRTQLLNPLSYTKLDPFTRKEALKDVITAISAGGSILGLAQLGGAEVDLNPTSTDFAKAKFGNTRVDLTGGFSPLIRFFAQGIDGLANISDDEARGPDVMRFIRSKLSPAAGAFVSMYSGKDYLGKEATIPSELTKIFTPMVAQDLYELYQEDPDLASIISGGAIAAVGGNVQVYKR